MYLPEGVTIGRNGHLYIAGCDAVEIAREFGTPVYVINEELVRSRCQSYHQALGSRLPSYDTAFAGKAFLTIPMCQLLAQEGMSLDVVSGGELYTALRAGFPSERIYFHGNNKSEAEIDQGLRAGVGRFVVDNMHELKILAKLATRRGKKAHVLLRVSPGIEAHTHSYIQTGQLDSKFGFHPGEQTYQAVRYALSSENLVLRGFHCHIGSQIFELDSFDQAVELMVELAAKVRDQLGWAMSELDIGGGLAVRYQPEDPSVSIDRYIEVVVQALKRAVAARNLPLPKLVGEPGRSIVGDAGTTIYTVGSSKVVPGVRQYVAVDGGMGDNPRVALYQAAYHAVLANRAAEEATTVVSIAGKCCESGDMLIWDIKLPQPQPGDLLAVFSTGAYNYSMSSNYNRLPRPPVVAIREGKPVLWVRRETYEDVVRCDLPLTDETTLADTGLPSSGTG